MPEKSLRIFSVSDKELLSCISHFARDCGAMAPLPTCTFFLMSSGPSIQGNLQDILKDPVLEQVLEAGSKVINKFLITLHAFNGTILQVTREGSFDTLLLRTPNEVSANVTVGLLVNLPLRFRMYDVVQNIEQVLGSEMASFYAKRDETLLRLESLSDKLIHQNEEYRRKLDEEHQKKSESLQAQFAERSHQKDSQLSARADELAQRETDLTNRLKELDDRSSRHARRQLRQDLKKVIESRNARFQLSRETIRKRMPNHYLFVSLAVATGLLVMWSFWLQLHPPEGANPWYVLLRFPLSVAVFGAAVVYYIRWNDLWAQRHADEEFHLKRLDLDIDRASWVVEMALEWKEEKGTEIPTDLIDRLSRNLFSEGGREVDTVKHPAQDLLSRLLAASESVRVQLPGIGEATVNRRGLQSLKKGGTKDQDDGGKE